MTNRIRATAFVPTVRPHLLRRLLETWEECPTVNGDNHVTLSVLAQREPAEEFQAVLDDHPGVVDEYEYRDAGGPVWPIRANWLDQHRDDLDVAILCDDDFELDPHMTNWWPAIRRAFSDPMFGAAVCGAVKTDTMLPSRQHLFDRPESQQWSRQAVLNTGGGIVLSPEAVRLIGDSPKIPWVYDDVMVGMTTYLDGLENWRFQGSYLTHRTLTEGGVAVIFQSQVLEPLDPRWITVSRATRSTYGAREENMFYMPTSSDLTPIAKMRHKMRNQSRRKQLSLQTKRRKRS